MSKLPVFTASRRVLFATCLTFVLVSVMPCLAQPKVHRGQPAQRVPESISAKLDAYIKNEMRKQQIPGFALAVVRNGKISLHKTYGLSNVEHQVPVKPETIFQSGFLLNVNGSLPMGSSMRPSTKLIPLTTNISLVNLVPLSQT